LSADDRYGSVIGEDGLDPVGDGLDEAAQAVHGRAARHLPMQFDDDELRGPINRDDEMELASAVRTSAMSIWKWPIG
jgi:hypothetical protein